MRENELETILDKAVDLGASYADVRHQCYDYEMITVENKALKSYSSRRLSGLGIRVAIKGAVGYASTSDLSQGSIEETLRTAIKAARSVGGEKKPFGETKISKADAKSPIKIDPIDVSPEDDIA